MNGNDQNLLNQEIVSRFIHPAMLLAFLGALLTFGIISIVLNYHWTQYIINKKKLTQIQQVYFGISALLFLIIGTFLLISIR